MKSTNLPGLYTWNVYQADRRIDFNGFFWNDAAGGILLDPMPLQEAAANMLRELGGAKWIVLTNADHFRAAAEQKQLFGAKIAAPKAEQERFGEDAAHVDHWYSRTEDLPEELQPYLQVFNVRGGKSPVEAALYLTTLKALLFGDVVRSHVSGQLMLLPDAKLQNRRQAIADLAPMGAMPINAVLLGDGDSLFNDGGDHFRRFVADLA